MKKYYEAYDDRYRQVHNEKNLAWAGEAHSPTIEKLLIKYGATINSSILEIGCGEGQNAIYLLSQGYNVIASDVSSEAIDWCKQKAEVKKVNEKAFFVMDVLSNKFSKKFDFIYSVAVLHMLVDDEDRHKFLQFIFNHLKPDGKAFIIVMGDGVTTRKTDKTKAFDLTDRQFGNDTIRVVTTSCRMVTKDEFASEIERANLKILNLYLDHKISGFSVSMVAEVERNK